MRIANYSNQFKKDVKLISKRGYNTVCLYKVMKALENEEVLDVKFKDHPLSGNYNGFMECHVEPDWLLIYKIKDKDLYFVRTGTHSDSF